MTGYRAPAPYMPAGELNGYLTRANNRANPSTDRDHSPRVFQEYINTGQFDVQLNNGLHRRIGQGLRSPIVNYLYALTVQKSVGTHDDYGGKHKRGIDPLSYNALVQNGPGSQPANPGGPGKIASNYLYNPGTC
jgi:hypothetical protein